MIGTGTMQVAEREEASFANKANQQSSKVDECLVKEGHQDTTGGEVLVEECPVEEALVVEGLVEKSLGLVEETLVKEGAAVVLLAVWTVSSSCVHYHIGQ